MILIADSGGTSTSWGLVEDTGVNRTQTGGYNALHSPDGALASSLAGSPLMARAAEVSEVHFYGAGCATPGAVGRVRRELAGCFPEATLHIASDMLGAARALCGTSAGIACILGTGSNSCLYDGERITANTPPLGYILGDEGSGAALGKRFLCLLLKGHLPKEIAGAFHTTFPELDTATVIERVYLCGRPNAFLASMCRFIRANASHPALHDMIVGEFRRFFSMNVAPYAGARTLPVHFTGSIAAHFSEMLGEAALAEGHALGRVMASPLDSLIDYHINIPTSH